MTKAKRIVARLAGILIFALSPMALAEEVASVQPVESVQIAQAENTARQTAPDSRPATLGDIHRLEGKIDQLGRDLNARLDTLFTLIVGILLAIIAAMAGIITIMLPRREKPRKPAPREPAQINPNTDKAPAR